MQLKGRHYENGEPVCVTVEGERIVSVEPAWPGANPTAADEYPRPLTSEIDDWPWIAPGLFDIQINGHGGTWFSKQGLTADEVIRTLEPHFQFGITRLCPTLITNSYQALAEGFAAIREACEREPWVEKMVPGCHLEGPYISPEDGPRGAHPQQHVRPADWDEFCRLQEASGNRICLVTLAPEVEGAIEFIRKATASGVVVAIGHTAANAERITAAVDAGARLSTHLGNGAHPVLRRHPNYIWEQLGEPRLWASIIADGHHLPASVVRSIIGVKGLQQTILTSDAAGLAGCPPGIYKDGPVALEILEDGAIVIAGQRQLLAGSGVETDTCVTKVREFAGLSLKEAIDLAGRNPARLLGVEEIRLRRSARADLILFHDSGPGQRLTFVATVAAGALRCGEIPSL